MIDVFKNIRKKRSIPPHKIKMNTYDKAFFEHQKKLIIDRYRSIRTLRLLLQNHPKTSSYEPPNWLDEGRII